MLIHAFIALISGLTFGLGLAFSEMTNPAVVIGFLDILGNWNPSLLLVMASAVIVSMLGYWLKTKRITPFLGKKWHIPTNHHIDFNLILGSSLFGIGWGISGYCPGPALTALTNNPNEAIYFVSALIAGSGWHHIKTQQKA